MSLKRLLSIIGVSLGFLVPLEALAALTISIEMGPDRVRPSEPLTAQITVANNGVAAVAGVTLQAPTPTGVNAFSALVISSGSVAATCAQTVSNNGVCDPLELISWNLGTIPAGASITVSLAMTVAAATPAGSSITLSPSALAGTVSASASVSVSADNALVLAVDENQDPIPAGGTLTYTLTYGNRSTSSVTGTALSFPLPAGTGFVSATGGGTLVGNEVQWALGTLPATQSDQQQVVVSVGGGLGAGSVLQVDNALLTGTSLAAETARAMAVTSIANPVLGLAVELNPDPVRPNEWTIAELTVTNRTGAAAFGVALQTRVPAGIGAFFTAWATGGLSCLQGISNNGACDALELGNWALGTIPAGASVTVSLALPVAAATAAGRLLTLESRVVDDSFHQSLLDQTAAVDSDNPLTLAVDENVEPVSASGLLTYNLTYANRSTTSLTATNLTFPIPAGATFVSASGGGALAGGKVQWALGNLPATQSGQQQVIVSVDPALGAGSILLVDTALITGSGVLQENARATATTGVAPAPALGLAVEVNPDPLRLNESGLAQLTVTNRTANALFGVVLQARFPQAMATESALLFTGGGACIAAINNGACDAAEIGNWNLGTIPGGGSIVVAAPIPVPNDSTLVGRLFTLETRVNDDSTHQALVKQTVAIDSDSPMTLAVDGQQDPVRSGSVQTYTLTYANRSSTSMSGTALTFPIPAGTTFVSATGGGALVGGNVVWALGNLPATQADSQQVAVAVNGGLAEGSILLVDAAQLTGTGVLSEVARATAASAVTASPAIGLAVELGPDPVRFNEWGYPELTVTNRTSNAMFNVVLQARFPVGMNAVNALVFTGGGSCIQGYLNNGACDNLELGVWNLGSLAPGASTTVSAPFPVTNTTALDGRLITVEAFVNDDSSHRSAARQTIAVDGNNPLTLAVDESADAVPAGSFLTYTLTYGNRSTSAVTGATLSFPLPAQATLAGSTGGVVSNGALVWNLGTIAAGTGGRRQVFMNVPGAVPAGSLLLSDEAVLRGTILVPETSRAYTAVAVEASKPLGLSLTFGRDPTQASAALNGSINVTNNTGATLSGIALDVRVPLGVNSFSAGLLTGTVTGTCVQGISNNGACDNLERATWAIPSIAAGATASEAMPMSVVATAGRNGQLMYLDARVNDDAGHVSTLSRTALVATFVDVDADTVHDTYDNCPFFANASQVDTDLDGRGDPCECTDQNGDGRNTVTDILAINTAIFNPGLATPLCDGNNDGQCNVNDIIAANIEIFSPTSTSTCSRYPVPGP